MLADNSDLVKPRVYLRWTENNTTDVKEWTQKMRSWSLVKNLYNVKMRRAVKDKD